MHSIRMPAWLAATAVAMSVAGCGDDDATLLERTADALGGREELLALSGLRVSNEGQSFITYQGASAGDPSLAHGTFASTLSYADGNLRVDYVRENLFVMATFTYSEIVQGDAGYVSGIDALSGIPTGDMGSPRLGSLRRTLRLMHPHLILRDALSAPGSARSAGEASLDGRPHERLVVEDVVAPVTMWVDRETGTPTQLVTLENHPLYRDQELVVRYAGWRAFSGELLFPESVAVSRGGNSIAEETRTRIEENPTLAPETFSLPPEATPAPVEADIAWGQESSQFHQEWASLGLNQDQRQTFILPNELAPGVFHLTGATHNSMAIEQEGGVVVVEAPLYPERSARLLDWVAAEFPGKPVTHVIATHHHADHTGGLREFVAAGAMVVVGEPSVAEFEGVFAAPSTIQPDRLSTQANPRVSIQGLGPSALTLADPVNTVEVQPVPSSHTDDMLLIYVDTPSDTFVFQSDLYNPGNGGSSIFPNLPAELLDSIEGSGFEVTQVVGGHGGTAPLSELEAFVGP